jgi:hypothetical protein
MGDIRPFFAAGFAFYGSSRSGAQQEKPLPHFLPPMYEKTPFCLISRRNFALSESLVNSHPKLTQCGQRSLKSLIKGGARLHGLLSITLGKLDGFCKN